MSMFRALLMGAVLLIGVGGCGDEDRPQQLDGGSCSGSQLFLYKDKLCGLTRSDAQPITCSEAGDGRCYLRCKQDSDCKDSARPFCTQIGLFAGGDYNCNKVVQACREKRSDWCKK